MLVKFISPNLEKLGSIHNYFTRNINYCEQFPNIIWNVIVKIQTLQALNSWKKVKITYYSKIQNKLLKKNMF